MMSLQLCLSAGRLFLDASGGPQPNSAPELYLARTSKKQIMIIQPDTMGSALSLCNSILGPCVLCGNAVSDSPKVINRHWTENIVLRLGSDKLAE